MISRHPVWYRRSLIGLMLLATALRLFYFFYTHRTWEDALITVQHSEDFARGMGLTHPVPPGEGPLHGFTSPLSVLIPLVGDLIHIGFGINLLRYVSAIAGAVTVLLGAQIALALELPYAAALGIAAFLAVEHHQILWGMAGMETQVVTLCYLAVLYTFLRGNQWQKGIALGFAMLARPDAAFLVLIALSLECWKISRTRDWKSLVPVLSGLVLLYGPWLLFAKLYYGSIIPNTIIAKGLGYESVFQGPGAHNVIQILRTVRVRAATAYVTLGPAYGGNGTSFQHMWDHQLVAIFMKFLMMVGTVVALVRRNAAAIFVCAFFLTYGVYLGAAANVMFGWYTVPVTAGAIIGCFYGAWAIIQWLVKAEARNRTLAIFAVCYILCIAVNLPATFHSDRYVQIDIESGVRRQMGEYLRDASYPTDTIASESLGYVGYYSGRLIYDYPGLCSRRVVQYLRDYPKERGLVNMMYHLRPTYLVLRPLEDKSAYKIGSYPWMKQDYELVRIFKARPQTDKDILFPDHNIDREFHVYRRKGAPFHEVPANIGGMQ